MASYKQTGSEVASSEERARGYMGLECMDSVMGHSISGASGFNHWGFERKNSHKQFLKKRGLVCPFKMKLQRYRDTDYGKFSLFTDSVVSD